MDDSYKLWLMNRIKMRDLTDYTLCNDLGKIKIKPKLLRKVDGATRSLALSLRDDYISESKNLDESATRYDGNITVLELILALAWPYEFMRFEGDKAVSNVKDEYGNSTPSYETRMERRGRIVYILLDQIKPFYDNKLVFTNVVEDLYSGKLREFLKLGIPNIEKMPIRDQLACFLHKKKIRKVSKKEMSDMIALVGATEGVGAYI